MIPEKNGRMLKSIRTVSTLTLFASATSLRESRTCWCGTFEITVARFHITDFFLETLIPPEKIRAGLGILLDVCAVLVYRWISL